MNDPKVLRVRAKGVFMEVLDAPENERASVIARACADDPALLTEVKALLAAYDRSQTAGARRTRTGLHSIASDRFDLLGQVIGRYQLVDRLGEGGFGEVYRAEQSEPVRRQVALKILKPGMDSRAVIARFEQERQALALMDHPHIAKVLDAGQTETGRPYFVMELVKGSPITEYCDSRSLGIRDRLRLFIPVCLAVQHAHQKGVIHRDIKPSNVMVTLADGEPVPKVIDFGIAKAAGARLTDKTLFTDFRVLLGTPEYMSPEQAEGSGGGGGADIDTRSDIYSLGVLLYELLTGTTPLDRARLRALSLGEIQRVIREEDPPRPSTRLSTLARTSGAPPLSAAPAPATALPDLSSLPAGLAIARQRGTDPQGLARLIRGDLDWIVMKAMEKGRARRYESASALAADIERHLRDETVSASPPSAGYRLSKLVRRYRVAFAAGTAVALALVIGLGLSIYGLVRAASERDQKELARASEAEQKTAAISAASQAKRRAYRASIAAAQAALQLGDGAAAARNLDAAPEELRSWEWWLLRHQMDRSQRREHVATGLRAGFAIDGEYLFLGDGNHSELYNWFTRERVSCATAPTGGPAALSVSPRSDRLMLCGYTASVLLDAASGAVVKFLPNGPRFEADAFSPDGSLIALSLNQPYRLALLDAECGDELRALPLQATRRSFPAFSQRGDLIAAEIDERDVVIVRPDDLSEVARVPGTFPRFTPDGRALMLLDNMLSSPRLIFRNTSDWSVRGTLDLSGVPLDPSGGRLRSIGVSPDSLVLAVMKQEGAVSLYDAESLRPLGMLCTQVPARGTGTPGGFVGFSRDGSHLAAMGNDLNLHVWDTAIGADPLAAAGMADTPTSCAAISADARWVVTGDWGRVMLWDAETGEPVWTRFHSLEFAHGIAFSPDGRSIAVAGDRGTLLILDSATGNLNKSAVPIGFGAFGSSMLESIAWPADGSLLIGTGRGELLTLDPDSLEIRSRRAITPGRVSSLAASPSGAVACVVSVVGPGGERLPSRTFLVTPDAPDAEELSMRGVVHVAWDAQGSRLALAGEYAGAILNRRDGSLIPLTETTSILMGPAFSPDGRRLACASSDGVFKLWDAASGELIADLPQGAAVRSFVARFSPDGSSLVAQTGEYTVLRFETRSSAPSVLAARETVRKARTLIGKLRAQVFDSPDVAERLRTDPGIPDDVRAAASRINSATRDHAAMNNNLAFLACVKPPDPLLLRRALRQSELAMAQSQDPYILNVRAIVLYRAGRFQEALDLLVRADDGYRRTRPGYSGPIPQVAAFRCLALASLGKTAEAREWLAKLEVVAGTAATEEPNRGWIAECRDALK